MEVAAAKSQISQLLSETLSSDCAVIRAATEALDRLSLLPGFPFYLLTIAIGNFFSLLYCLCQF